MKLDFRNSGIVGSILLAVGPFLPFVSVPLLGSLNYFSGGSGDGIFIIAFSAIALAGTLLRKPTWLMASAAASIALLGFTLFNVFTGSSDFSRFVSLQIGPLVILTGAGLLFFAVRRAPEEIRSKARPFKPFSRGNFAPSILGMLGALTSFSAPIVLSVLYSSVTNPSAMDLLFSWFVLGFTSAVLFLIAPLASLFLLFRGRLVPSLLAGLLAILFYFQAEGIFWGSRSRELAADILPSLSFVFLLAIGGTLLLVSAAGLRALSIRKNPRIKRSSNPRTP